MINLVRIQSKKKLSFFSLKRSKSFRYVLLFLFLFTLSSVIITTSLGPVSIPFGTTIKIIGNQFPFLHYSADWTVVQENIVLNLRLPRVLLGWVVGASLATTGVVMQALIRNELADPFILGVSSGASATATVGILFGAFSFFGVYALPLSAFLGATVTTTIVYSLSRERGKIVISQLLLAGVVISMMMDGLTRIVSLSAPNALGLHNAQFWMSGSLAGAKWDYLFLPTVVLVVCLFFLFVNYRSLNLLMLGENTANHLGINVRRTQKFLILVSSLITGVVVAVSGTIGFVGLICPHFGRLLVGADHRKVLPISALMGGVLVVWTDVLARMLLAPEELPIGTLTALFGGPIFIFLLKRRRKH